MYSQNALARFLTPSERPLLRALHYLILFAVLTVCYFVAARLGLVLRVYYGDITPLWPPSGIAVALLWHYGLHWLPVVAVSEFIIASSLGQPPSMGLIGGLAQSLEALIATLLLSRQRVEGDLTRPTQVCLFVVFGALLPPLVGATIGTTALHFHWQIAATDFLSALTTWWLGDAMGILIITPFIVRWSSWPFASVREFYRWLGLMVVLIAAGGSVAALERAHYASLFFLLLPFMVVAAAHYGTVGATSTAVIMAALVLGMKVDARMDDWQIAIKLAFIGVTAFAGYLIAAVFAVQRRSWQQLSLEQERAWVTLRSIGDGVIATDAHGKTDFMNPAAERITGWSSAEARGLAVESVLALDQSSSGPGMLRTKAGTWVSIESVTADIHTSTGYDGGKVVTFRDISEEQRLQQELAHQANHDVLTGLHNRRAFERDLRHLTEEIIEPVDCALLYLDLDQFKVLNDTCGHEAGDKLLAELGERLRDLIVAPNLFARTGGDEFGVLLYDQSEQQVVATAENLRRAILDYRFNLSGLSFSVGVSIGIAPFVAGKDTSAAVLSRADIACYKAKEEGRNRIYIYRIGDVEMVARHGELERVSQLRTALQEKRFRLHWQRIDPIPNVASTQPVFYEVLLRLEEDGEIVSPARFMPSAERFGFVPTLDRWVIETVFRRLHPAQNLLVGINLDATTLDDPTFYDFVLHTLQHADAAASQICFEISEKVTINRLNRAVDTINKLRALGFRFALDDFGSGVASFGYLDELPVDFVKIDGRFVQGLQLAGANLIVVEALTKLAAAKGISCVAEWVESKEVMDHLERLGVAFAQGFYLHRPEPIGLVERFA